MQGIAAIGVEKYKNFLGENTPRPPYFKCDTTPNVLLPTNHLSFLYAWYSMVPFCRWPPTDEFLKNALSSSLTSSSGCIIKDDVVVVRIRC
jgi:hypothetical protein